MNELVRNSAKLLSANVFAQVLGLLVYPILTRLYLPEDFGMLNLFLSVGAIFCLISTAELQYAIVLPKEDSKAASLIYLGVMCVLTVMVLVGLTMPISDSIAVLFHAPGLSVWWSYLPIFIGALGLWTLLSYFYTRVKAFGFISRYQVSQSLLSSVCKIVLGYMGLAWGLLASTIFVPVLVLLLNLTCFRVKHPHLLRMYAALVNKEEISAVAREYANFPKFNLPRALVNNLGGNLPTLLLTPFFGLEQVGFFAMAITLAFRPINMVASSLYQTFYQRTSESVNMGRKIMPFFTRFLGYTAALIIPVFGVLYFFLPQLTLWLLGEGWSETGLYIGFMLPWLAMSAMAAPICFLSDIFFKQKLGLLFEILFLVARLLGLAVGIWLENFRLAILLYSLGGALVIFCQLIWFLSLARAHDRSLS